MIGWRNLDQAGDTIIEVLIAMAVVSLVLGGAYATADTSLQNTQQAQERSEALKVVEMETEILNTASQLKSTDPGYVDVFNSLSPIFCLHPTGNPTTPFSIETINSSDPKLPVDIDQFTHYQTCTYNPDGTSGLSNRYNTAIIYDTSKQSFTVQVRWFRLGGNKDELQLNYRAYNGS